MLKSQTLATLSTINAPYRTEIGAEVLAECLSDHRKARAFAGHLSVFFEELPYEQQKTFALSHGVSEQALEMSAYQFRQWAGLSQVQTQSAP